MSDETGETNPTPEQVVLAGIEARIQQVIAALQADLAEVTGWLQLEVARLDGKIEGVAVAKSGKPKPTKRTNG